MLLCILIELVHKHSGALHPRRHLNQFCDYLSDLGVPLAPRVPWCVHRYNSRDAFLSYLKRYGRVWGQFSGIWPHLYVADPELLKEILVKQFDKFLDRQHFPVDPKVRMKFCKSSSAVTFCWRQHGDSAFEESQ